MYPLTGPLYGPLYGPQPDGYRYACSSSHCASMPACLTSCPHLASCSFT